MGRSQISGDQALDQDFASEEELATVSGHLHHRLKGRYISDMPPQDGDVLVWSTASGVWYPTTVSGASVGTFIDLSDTPYTYEDAARSLVRVNVAETGLEFLHTGTPSVEIDATFSGIIRHGYLLELNEDQHPALIPRDGSRGFTSTVSGVDPIEDYHISTKYYVNDEITTVSGALKSQLDNHTGDNTIHFLESDTVEYIGDITGEPTGYPNNTDSQISFVDGTRTFSIQPADTSFDYFIHGIKYTVSGTDTFQIDDTEGLWYVYYDDTTITGTQTFNISYLYDQAFTAVIYWDAANDTAIYMGDERHGLTMDGQTHSYLHLAFGARWVSGLALGNITADGDGSSDTHAQISVAAGSILDEDLLHSISAQSFPAQIPVFYKSGTNGYWRRDTATTFPVKPFSGGSNRLAWNEFTGSTWQQTEVNQADFVLAHIYATNDPNTPIVAIQGQETYANISSARTGAAEELNNLFTGGMPFVEFVALGTLIYQTNSTYTNSINARIRTTDDGSDYIDWRQFTRESGGSTNDHGNLSGLLDDDHSNYLLTDGARQLSGDWDFGSFTISGSGDIHGNYIHGDGSNLINIDHNNLLNIGTTTHSGIDAHIATSGIHFTWEEVQVVISGSVDPDVLASGTGFRDIQFVFGTANLPHLVCADEDWVTRRTFVFQGTDKLGTPQFVLLTAALDVGAPSIPGYFRLYDTTNLNEIAYIENILGTVDTIYTDNNPGNWPSDQALFDLQLKVDKKGEMHVHSMIIAF